MELVENVKGTIVISPYATMWAAGNYYILAKNENEKVLIEIKCIPSVMKEWILVHANQCEVIAPKHFRDEIQKAIMEAYKIYWR